MSPLVDALRALHYASAMLLFGELVFALYIAGPAWRGALAAFEDGAVERRFFAVARRALGVSIASGAAWFAAETAIMSGLPVEEAMAPETLALVIGNTGFGLAFTTHAGLAVALLAVIIVMRRSNHGTRRAGFAILVVAIAAGYLGSLAWTGHAVAGDESEGLVRIVAGVTHLLAAGAWLGALPALVSMLGRTRSQGAAAEAARRFSTLGVASVGVLTASGLANTWYQVGSVPSLLGTDYGRLLVAKLALFAAMLVLATINRGIATQPLSGGDRKGLRLLRRNAVLETALGIGVIAIVGVLGVTVPAIHQPVTWPFDHTLSLDPIRQSAWMQLVVAAVGAVGCIAVIALGAGALGRPPHIRPVAIAGVVIAGGILAFLLAVPSHPTTYLASPVGYTAEAVATGATLYAEHCSDCHGGGSRGGGPNLLSAGNRQLGLGNRVPDLREGDLFWSIAQGVPGAPPGPPMPGFAAKLSGTEIWSLVQFLDAQAAAQNARAMSDRVKPLRPVPAPDFTYEFIGQAQESLRQQSASQVTLLVFYTLPSSLPRLREIATLEQSYKAAGARVVAVPMSASTAPTDIDWAVDGESILALASPAVATTYTMFARSDQGGSAEAPTHLEFLIDRFGYLRVRWIGVGSSAETLRQIDLLVREPPRAPVQWGHRH